MAEEQGKQAIMDVTDVATAIAWQADHSEQAGAPCTARVIRAERAILDTDTGLARRMNNWAGLSLRDAMPLRVAAGLHYLFLSGVDRRLEPVFAGLTTDQAAVDDVVADMAVRYDARLMPWLDGPPQTNEASRSASFMAALLWLSERLGPRFEMYEIGASAGINTMMGRYHYNLGGVKVGPSLSRMKIEPDWRGPKPPKASVEIVAIKGSDIAPVDLTDPDQVLRLKAYIWADARDRMARMDAAAQLAQRAAPELERKDARAFVEEMLAAPQEEGATRVLYHSVMWQYLPAHTREAITGGMERAGAEATKDKPLAWIRLETNRETFSHELTVRYWPGGEEETHLATAHPHGAWIEWLAGPANAPLRW